MKARNRITLIISSLFITACSGGGGGSSTGVTTSQLQGTYTIDFKYQVETTQLTNAGSMVLQQTPENTLNGNLSVNPNTEVIFLVTEDVNGDRIETTVEDCLAGGTVTGSVTGNSVSLTFNDLQAGNVSISAITSGVNTISGNFSAPSRQTERIVEIQTDEDLDNDGMDDVETVIVRSGCPALSGNFTARR